MTRPPLDVLTPATGDYVLPSAVRGRGEVYVDAERADLPGVGDARLRAVGERWTTLAQCQAQFLGELRSRLAALDADVTDGGRARLQGEVREALEVLDWCDAVQAEFATEGARIAAGQSPIDVRAICERAVRTCGLAPGSVQVTGECAEAWWGEEGKLAEVVRAALALVAERTGGNGAIVVEVGRGERGPTIRVAGSGDPVDEPAGSAVRQFRRLVHWTGVQVEPDGLGPAAPALVLVLPRAAD